jgi:hypothetical protein
MRRGGDACTCNIPCAVGMHEPVIVHRSGGRSAKEYNFCGKCGHFIRNVDGVWMLDEKHEVSA